MVVKVVHLETGVTEVKNNVDQVLESEDRFELVDKREKGAPQTSTSYHRSLFRFEVLGASKKACSRETKDCLNCGASMSADDENGEQYLVCSAHGYDRVPEDGYCDDYN